MRDIDAILYRNGVAVMTDKKNEPEKWLTKEQAIAWLAVWRDCRVPKYNLDFSIRTKRGISSGTESAYISHLLNTLIERIRESNDDPLTVVGRFWYAMDEILATSDDDHYITHQFAGFMENETHRILNFLQRKEKEMNEC